MDSVDGIIKGIDTASGIFDSIYSRIENIKRKKLSINNLTRAYYFEVVNNIELLTIVDLDNFSPANLDMKLLKSLMSKLETEIGATILFSDFDDQTSGLYKLLESRGRIENRDHILSRSVRGREIPIETNNFYENILQAISFTVVKTETLRRISTFSDDDRKMLKTLHINRRISNILERFKMIQKKLETLPAIVSVAR